MNVIIRPEYYVIPGKHPPDCRCSEHALKALLGVKSPFAARGPLTRPADSKRV